MENLADVYTFLMFILLPLVLLLGFVVFKTYTNLSVSELIDYLPIPNWVKLFLLPVVGLLTAAVFVNTEITSIISGLLMTKYLVSPIVFQEEASFITKLLATEHYGYTKPIPCTKGWDWLNASAPQGWEFKCENGNRYIISPPLDTEAIKNNQMKVVIYTLGCHQSFLKDNRLYCLIKPYF